MKYYFPCKPNPLSPTSPFFDELDRDTAWVAEVKKNGWRCLVYRDSGLVLWTRHHTTIDEPVPELRERLMAVPDQTVLDSEFLHHRTAGIKGFLYLFDILVWKGKVLINLPLQERRKYLEGAIEPDASIEIAHQVRIGKKQLFTQAIRQESDEGIVLKKLDSRYLVSESRCLQHPFWLKVKRPETHWSRTCKTTNYGKGGQL
jgi:ATP-dependent DNA ligase